MLSFFSKKILKAVIVYCCMPKNVVKKQLAELDWNLSVWITKNFDSKCGRLKMFSFEICSLSLLLTFIWLIISLVFFESCLLCKAEMEDSVCFELKYNKFLLEESSSQLALWSKLFFGDKQFNKSSKQDPVSRTFYQFFGFSQNTTLPKRQNRRFYWNSIYCFHRFRAARKKLVKIENIDEYKDCTRHSDWLCDVFWRSLNTDKNEKGWNKKVRVVLILRFSNIRRSHFFCSLIHFLWDLLLSYFIPTNIWPP